MRHLTRRGDTMIEVMFGVAIFGLIAIGSISLMNNGLATSETNLESTMARNEMNAQAEALRFIHSSYASAGTVYQGLWAAMTQNALTSANADIVYNVPDSTDCSSFYEGGNIARSSSAFVINTAKISDNNADNTIITKPNLYPAESDGATFPYPFVNTSAAYGIWINAVQSAKTDGGKPYYYDFYIRSCWYGTGSSTPSMLDTVVRLYNPDRTR